MTKLGQGVEFRTHYPIRQTRRKKNIEGILFFRTFQIIMNIATPCQGEKSKCQFLKCFEILLKEASNRNTCRIANPFRFLQVFLLPVQSIFQFVNLLLKYEFSDFRRVFLCVTRLYFYCSAGYTKNSEGRKNRYEIQNNI